MIPIGAYYVWEHFGGNSFDCSINTIRPESKPTGPNLPYSNASRSVPREKATCADVSPRAVRGFTYLPLAVSPNPLRPPELGQHARPVRDRVVQALLQVRQLDLQPPARPVVLPVSPQPEDVADVGHAGFEVGDLARVQVEDEDFLRDVAGAAEAGEVDVLGEEDFAGAVASFVVGVGGVAEEDDGEVFDVPALGVCAVVALTHRCGLGVEIDLEDWLLLG